MIRFSVIKDKVKGKSGTISIKQRGRKLRVQVSPKDKPIKGVTSSVLIDWMRHKSLCISQMKNLTAFIRHHFGKLSVEKYANDTMFQHSHQLDEYFELVNLDFLDSDGQSVTKSVPIVTDPSGLINFLHKKMELDIHETYLKVGIDAGHGSLKVILFMTLFIVNSF